MTTVYSIAHSEGIWYEPTKAEAISQARKVVQDGDPYVSVTALVIGQMPLRELYCALLNGEAFAAEQTRVWSSQGDVL